MPRLHGGKRIAVNTIVSYTRTIIGLFLVLFSSRWALLYLGAVDFGLYNLIGSVLALVVFLNTVLSNSDSRFFAVSIGKNDIEEIQKVFNVSLSLHLVMPIIVTVIGVFMGEWILKNFLVIPPERMDISILVFRLTMLTAFLSMITIPFSTLMVANQNIIEYSLVNLLLTFLMFVSAYLLRFSFLTSDKLLLYAILISGSYIICNLILIILSCYKYKYARIRFCYFFNRDLSLEIMKYSFWNMLGDLGHLVRTQGISFVVNLFFGPTGNAALGIANQISMQVSNLTNAMGTATAPEIYRRVGEGNRESSLSLSLLTSKVGVFLMLILGIPTIFNITSLLELWLINVPDGTMVLCVSYVIMFIFEKVTIGQYYYMQAIGRVAVINILVFLSYCTSVLFPFCGLIGVGIAGIGIACILSMIISRISIIYCFKKETKYNLMEYFRSILTPVVILVLFVLFCIYFRLELRSQNLLCLSINGLATFVITFIMGFYLLFDQEERGFFKNVMNKKISQWGNLTSSKIDL